MDKNSIWKDLFVAVIAALATVFSTKACDRISPEENKVVISDTLRVIETHAPQSFNDSLLYVAISELNRTIKESATRNNRINIVWPESRVTSGHEKHDHQPLNNNASTDHVVDYDSRNIIEHSEVGESNSFVNKVVYKNGFYKKGYTIGDGGVFYVLENKPKVEDKFLIFDLKLIQPAELLSHIYLNICATNENGELYRFFGQNYEVKDDLNRIKIVNNLRDGKNRIEIGVFLKSDEGMDFPTYYRNVFSLEK